MAPPSRVDVRYRALDSRVPFGLDTSVGSNAFSTATAIVLQLAVIALLVVVLQVDIFIESWSGLSNDERLAYTTGITILATLITASTTGAIRKLWIIHVTASSSRPTEQWHISARVITGLGGFKDQFRRWQASLAFILAGLITTVVVVTLTPRTVVSVAASLEGHLDSQGEAGFCINEVARRSTAGQWFFWHLPDGSFTGLDQNATGVRDSYCNPRFAVDRLLARRGAGLPSNSGYAIEDTLVLQGALGAPFSTDGPPEKIFGIKRSLDFRWATRCLPILERNPVRCSPAGSVKYSDTNNTLSVTNGDCKIQSRSLQVTPSNSSAAILGACTQGKAVGAATILIGAVDEITGVRSKLDTAEQGYATLLRRAMNDTMNGGRSYAVTCTVDVGAAVGLRTLNYSRSDNLDRNSNATSSLQSDYGYTISAVSTDACEMIEANSKQPLARDQLLTSPILAGAAGATWPLLAENMNSDGWFDSLWTLASQSDVTYDDTETAVSHLIFPDSINRIEDALGSVTTLTIGFDRAENLFLENSYTLAPAPSAYVKVRLGPSNRLGYLYLLPSLFSIGLIAWLSWQVWRHRPSGDADS